MDGLGGPASPEESRFRAENAQRMSYQAAAPQEINLDNDPTWGRIKSAFDDILGGIANNPVDMPIALPDTNDPQDVLRYLSELEKAGIDSRAQASYLGAGQRGGMQFSDALNMMKFLYTQNKDNMNMLAKILPNITDKEMQAQMTSQLLNMMQPGYFGTVDPWLGRPKTTMLNEGNIADTFEFKRIADAYAPQLGALAKTGDQKNYNLVMNQIERLLTDQYKWPKNVVEAALQRLHAQALTAKASAGDMYGEL